MRLTTSQRQVLVWMYRHGGPPGRMQFKPGRWSTRTYGHPTPVVIACRHQTIRRLLAAGLIEPNDCHKRDTYELTEAGAEWLNRRGFPWR